MAPRLISLLGLLVFIGIAWVCSNKRRAFPVRTVIAGLALQFAFAFFILNTGPGHSIFDGTQKVVNKLNDFSNEGADMAFGPLAHPESLTSAFGPKYPIIFAVTISATIILISALSALLYHWGVLQRVVGGIAWVMERMMRTSGSESFATASNIFLGQTESALVVKPYIATMTKSEIMALMTGGMATIATGVMVVYPTFGMEAGHILTASFLAAPASLLVSKVMYPETEKSLTATSRPAKIPRTDVNSLDALCRGTSEGVMLAINVMGMLIAFVAVVALFNACLTGIEVACGVPPASVVNLQTFLGWLNWPFAWLMGVPTHDCLAVGQALGERVTLNEFVAYIHLGQHKAALDPRSFTLATYALCGFANFSSIAIQIGGIGALAPERRHDLARLGFRSMIAGLISCYITATIAGIIIG
jgi:concentrative nucleoside transporter, CNT family